MGPQFLYDLGLGDVDVATVWLLASTAGSCRERLCEKRFGHSGFGVRVLCLLELIVRM